MSSVRTTTSVRLISLLLFLSQQLTPVLNTENSCFFREHRIIQKGVSNSEVALRLSFGRCYFEMQANHANGYHAELVL